MEGKELVHREKLKIQKEGRNYQWTEVPDGTEIASQDIGERSNLGQDEVPSSTEAGKKEVKADTIQICF